MSVLGSAFICKKVFGDKEPKDLSLEECKKAVAGKLKPKAKPKKKKKVIKK
jgi:DNA topoisomerase-1